MKSIISLILAALMLISAVACGTPAPDTAVNATASAPEQFLIDRLGEVPENVVLGDAAVAAEYGIDMTDFEDEGYIVRTAGDKTLIFGKTEAGLDRAVRYYANYVHGNDTPADITFGEGAPVDLFTIESHDISEYVITVTEAHPDGSYPESTEFAAAELSRYIEKATGAAVPVISEAELVPGTPHFRFTCDGTGANGEEGFTVTVTPEGNVEILGGLKRGCLYAAYDLSEKWFGIRFVDEDYTYIYEADHVAITAADSYSDAPGMEYRHVYTRGRNGAYLCSNKTNGAGGERYGGLPIINGTHGLYRYWQNKAYEPNLCMNDEEIFAFTIENIDTELWAAKQSGALYADNYYQVYLGLNDVSTYCYCDTCMAIANETGGQTESYINFTKKIADNFADIYPEAQFSLLAYNGTEKPVDTVLPDNMTVTYCVTSPCYCGPMDGSECDEGRTNDNGYTAEQIGEYISGWQEVAPNFNLWIYYFSYTVNIPKNPLKNLYDDIRYFYGELGVTGGMFLEWEDLVYAYDTVGYWLATKLMWDPDMSREEFDTLVDEIMYLNYGDGYEKLIEYTYIYDTFVLCADSKTWGGAVIDYYPYTANGEYFLYLFDEALRLAETERQRHSIDLLSVHMLCNIMTGRYKSYYLNGTAEKKAEYEALAARLKRIFDEADAPYLSFMREVTVSDIDYTADPYTWLLHR